jgi:hypothetical protein
MGEPHRKRSPTAFVRGDLEDWTRAQGLARLFEYGSPLRDQKPVPGWVLQTFIVGNKNDSEDLKSHFSGHLVNGRGVGAAWQTVCVSPEEGTAYKQKPVLQVQRFSGKMWPAREGPSPSR